MRATGSSSSCASRVGSTGWSATISTASIARLGSSLTGAPTLVASPVVAVDLGEARHPAAALHLRRIAADPDDRQLREVGDLLELDESLLVQLEDCEEPHDDLEPLDERPGE